MGVIFYNQKAAALIGVTGVDFDSVAPVSMAIKYKKPSGAEGFWVASVYEDGENPENDRQQGKIIVEFNDSQYFDELGWWTLWSHITLEDGRQAPGLKFRYWVKTEGT